jgi:hypothetical protein
VPVAGTRSQSGTGRNLKVLPVWLRIAKQATNGTSRAIGTRSMSEFGTELAHLMTARSLGVRELGRLVPCNPGHISNLRNGKASASPELARCLDELLGADGTLTELAVPHRRRTPAGRDVDADDEIAALELGRRAEASDVGSGTVERLTLAMDELATAYPGTPPAELLGRVRAHLAYVGQLMDTRSTLTQHRGLLVVGGWLSLLAATCLIDLHQDAAAAAHLHTAAQLARETGHAEIAAWCLETQAWHVLTKGEYQKALNLAQGAQHIAPREGSATSRPQPRRAVRGLVSVPLPRHAPPCPASRR